MYLVFGLAGLVMVMSMAMQMGAESPSRNLAAIRVEKEP